MRLIIVRHGETEKNVKKIIQGQTHGTLTKKGIQQHKKLAKRFKDEKIDVIYSSDLGRTKHLAKEILKCQKSQSKRFLSMLKNTPRALARGRFLTFHKIPINYAKELRERKFGIFEGKPHGSVRKYTEEKGIPYSKFKPKKGESADDMQKRTETFTKKIINKYKNTNKTILFVTHAGFITHLLLYILGLDRTKENASNIIVSNTAVTILEIDKKGAHKAKLINCIKHL